MEEQCYGCNCGSRQFLTKEEKHKKLMHYKDSLEHELKAVNERITEIGKK